MKTTASPAINYWPDNACAKAFWSQHELPSYGRLLADTKAWLDPAPGERWLDLGCGGGQLTRAVWEKSGGSLAGIVALDCAAANAQALDKLRKHCQPVLPQDRLYFIHSDFSNGLAMLESESLHGVVSGLSIQYAEHFDQKRGCWTTEAYDSLLAEVYRILKVGGRFVFSVNVPEPSWGKVALVSMSGVFRTRQPGRFLKNAFRMWKYGFWLKREARRGRFHYLPLQSILYKLAVAGFGDLEHRLSFAKQAYLIRCRKTI